jgi:hypothetical protein
MSGAEKLSKAIEEAIYEYRTQYPDSLLDVERVIAQHLAVKVTETLNKDINRTYRDNYLDALHTANAEGYKKIEQAN